MRVPRLTSKSIAPHASTPDLALNRGACAVGGGPGSGSALLRCVPSSHSASGRTRNRDARGADSAARIRNCGTRIRRSSGRRSRTVGAVRNAGVIRVRRARRDPAVDRRRSARPGPTATRRPRPSTRRPGRRRASVWRRPAAPGPGLRRAGERRASVGSSTRDSAAVAIGWIGRHTGGVCDSRPDAGSDSRGARSRSTVAPIAEPFRRTRVRNPDGVARRRHPVERGGRSPSSAGAGARVGERWRSGGGRGRLRPRVRAAAASGSGAGRRRARRPRRAASARCRRRRPGPSRRVAARWTRCRSGC